MRILSEEEQKHICKCEGCGFKPLKHFQRCPKCYSEAWHSIINHNIKQKAEVKG